MTRFLIAGQIVDTDSERQSFEDVTPSQLNSFINGLAPDEELVLEITSYGGSVTAGLAICNLLKQASANGHKTTAHVIGIAASMSSAIACACDKLTIDANALMMLHNPWTIVQGNADEIREEADTLDKYRDALLAIYRTKIAASDEVIKKMLDDETWILGKDAKLYGFDCEIIPTEEPLKAAAFAKGKLPKFLHTPQMIKDLIMTNEETKKADGAENAPVENQADETAENAAVEEPETVTPETETAHAEEPQTITLADCEKRVSGMQSAMAKKLDALRKEYEDKISDFTSQLKVKDEELATAKADATRLVKDLETVKATNEELSKKTSALESALTEKSNALAALNASVNSPDDATDWRQLKGKAFFDWYQRTH